MQDGTSQDFRDPTGNVAVRLSGQPVIIVNQLLERQNLDQTRSCQQYTLQLYIS